MVRRFGGWVLYSLEWLVAANVVDGAQTRRKKTTLSTKATRSLTLRRRNAEKAFFRLLLRFWLTHKWHTSVVQPAIPVCAYNKCNWMKWMRRVCVCVSASVCLSVLSRSVWRHVRVCVFMKLIATDNWLRMCGTRSSLHRILWQMKAKKRVTCVPQSQYRCGYQWNETDFSFHVCIAAARTRTKIQTISEFGWRERWRQNYLEINLKEISINHFLGNVFLNIVRKAATRRRVRARGEQKYFQRKFLPSPAIFPKWFSCEIHIASCRLTNTRSFGIVANLLGVFADHPRKKRRKNKRRNQRNEICEKRCEQHWKMANSKCIWYFGLCY